MKRKMAAHGLAMMLAVTGFAAPGLAAVTASCDAPVAIQFDKGAASAVREGGIARGELSCWTIAAVKGQVMTVQLQSTGDNAVMQAYAPGWRVSQVDGTYRFAGAALKGAAEGDDAPGWCGTLAVSGRYLIVLGTKAGGSDFKVTVSVRRAH
jgi:hypothetical protein